MEAGLIILALDGKGEFIDWLIGLTLRVTTPGLVTPIRALWVDIGLLLNSEDPDKGDTACVVGRRGVSVGVDTFEVS